MRLATFNAENLFLRPAAMNYADNAVGQPVLDDFHRINTLLKEPSYTESIREEIERLFDKYRLLARSGRRTELELREVRGQLWQQKEDGTRIWTARGAADYLGWVELVREAIDDRAIRNTARVLAEVSADVQLLVEVEDRVTLQRFHDDVLVPELRALGKAPYRHILLMDGNDPREIDVGLLSRLPVAHMKSHVDLRNAAEKPLFARDCAWFTFELPGNATLVLLGNHFTSQGSDRIGKRRKEQAQKTREICDAALQSTPHVVVAGDLNEPPARGNLSPLIGHPELLDAMSLDAYPDKASFPGTYQSGSKANKLDYLFLSKSLQQKATAVGVERRGFRSTKWTPFDTVVDARTQASDHHCVWVDLAL